MAGAFSLTCLEKIGGTLFGKIGECFVAPIQRQFTYICCFNSNFTELETQLQKLETTKRGVQMGVDENIRNVRVVGPTIEDWLTSANEVTTEVEGIIQDKAKVKEGCLNGWCPNLKLRYSLSRKAMKKTTVVVDLWKDGDKYTQSSYNPPPASLETIPNRDFKGFESRRLMMEQIIKALKHDEINLIGVSGMGGVGKTTMVHEVAKRAKEDSLFEEVAMAVVGQEPILINVQDCIADMLGLKELREAKSPIVRANLLRKRLVQDNKKVLVILDDIWVEFDLQAMGIPLEGANKNFKMLYTSRSRDLWHDVRTKKEIPLELLSEDEAWQLFREKAGDSVDAPDLQPIAKKIVRECGRLPLALVLIGSALSKKIGRNAIKDIWEGMLDRLTCARSTPADNQLHSRLELSYEFLEDKEAKRLFLLCCLFQEDEDIRIEDLARYGFGLSLFDGINEMAKVRRQVFYIVDDLKSRYLLLDSEKEECVKVHDVVRDMGISIASKDKYAIVSHGAASEWPKTVTHEHYIAISLISEKIKELPEGLTYPNLEFLMLRCHELEKLRPDFFEGMGKLKVLELKNFHRILTFLPLKNLTTLALEGFCGMLDNVRVIGDLVNLEILSFRNSEIKELPEEIRGLVNLRLLDLSRMYSLERIPPGVLACLVRLEELYVIHSNFEDWEGEGQKEGRNANLKEFESLSYLNTLEIVIKKHVVIPKLPIFGKLKKYKVIQEDLWQYISFGEDSPYERQLMITEWNWDTPAGRGGIDTLLRSSDCLFLRKGSNDLVQLLLPNGVDSLQQLKYLEIEDCDTRECLAITINPVQPPPNATAVFPILEELRLYGVRNLREICRSPVPAGSFGQLTKISIYGCERLRNLFQLPIVGCLAQLKSLDIRGSDEMEEVFIWKEQREDVHVAPNNRIEFPKLEFLNLCGLPSLVGFCRGIDQIDLPQLKELELEDLRKVNCLFHNNNNLSSNSEQNDNIVSFLSLFPKKVSLPYLEVLRVSKLENLERLGHGPLSMGSLFKLNDFSVRKCGKLLCVFPSQLVPMLRNLENLSVGSCNLLEVVFELEGVDSNVPKPRVLSPLKVVKLGDLPKLNYISKRDPMGFKYIQTLKICNCDSLRYVFAPTVTKSIPQLLELRIQRCEMLSRIVAEENGMGESSVDEFEFPQLERLELVDLPNLRRFSHFTHPLKLPLLSEMEILRCPSMDLFSLGHVSTPNLSLPSLWWYGDLINAKQFLQENGDDPMATSMEKPRTLDDVTDKSKPWQVAETQCRLVAMPDSTDGPHKVARLLYSNTGNVILALGCDGRMRLWKWGRSKHNPSGKATASVVPQQWQPTSGLAMSNHMTGAILEEAVPCIALSNNDTDIISACGGAISLFNMIKFKVMKKFKPPPPASTFLAFYPRDNNVIAIGMEDSIIHIYNVRWHKVESILEGHQKHITGLAFSTNLDILVSSGADAQLCIWSIDTWKKLKSVPIQLPTCKAHIGDTRVQFHSDQIRLLVSHETQLAIYDASKMDRIRQWVPQYVIPAPISFATYSCDSRLVYTSFCDGNIGVFDADSLTLRCHIAPSVYLSPALLSGSQAVYPLVVAAHPQLPNQFAIGLTDGSVIVMEPPTITGPASGTASSSNKRKKEEKREKKGKAPISG